MIAGSFFRQPNVFRAKDLAIIYLANWCALVKVFDGRQGGNAMASMEFKDLAGVVFGATGFIISIYNLFKARAVEKRTITIALNQKRQDALNIINRSEASLRRANRMLERLAQDAISLAEFEVRNDVIDIIAGNDRRIKQHEIARNALKGAIPEERIAQQKLDEALVRALLEFSDTASDLPEMEAAKLVDQTRDNWALQKQIEDRSAH